ncbi:MAG: DUF484 family protein [Gammaproteobacteria bacterium]|nr:DUF484 family protein [Gammaproteobacteria bacterium]
MAQKPTDNKIAASGGSDLGDMEIEVTVETAQTDTPDERLVIAYLRKHINFFKHHKKLLSELNLPHASGQAVSLVEHQVSILRERNVDMRRRMNNLVKTAKENDELFSKIRNLTLALLDANTPQGLDEVLAKNLLLDFEADFVCCHIRSDVQVPQDTARLEHILFHSDQLPLQHLVHSETPVCSSLREDELNLMFPMNTHNDPGSAVMLSLSLSTGAGILAIGSRQQNRFSSDMDTLFVTYMADILSKVLQRIY